MNINFINMEKLGSFSKEDLEVKLDKKTLDALEIVLDLENKFKFIDNNNKLLEYQNTNFENYQFILKDFIDEINKSSKIISNCLIELFQNFKDIIVDNPIFLGHKIVFNEETQIIESYTIKEHYCNYLNYVNYLGLKVSNFLKFKDIELYEKFNKVMLFSHSDSCMLNNNELVKYTINTLFDYKPFQDKRARIVLSFGNKLNNLLKKYKDSLDKDLIESLEFFSYKTNFEHDWYINNAKYSNNLFDERIIPKNAQILFYKDQEYEFNVIALDTIKVKKESNTWTYNFICTFDICFYIKKYFIELYTKKDMFSFMCLYKDFLINYNYLHSKNKNDFVQDHPMIKEANLLNDVQERINKFDKRFFYYQEKINEIKEQSNDVLIITRNIKDWCDILSFPEQTKRFFMNKFQKNSEPTIEEFERELNLFVDKVKKEEIKKILNTPEKELLYKNIELIEDFFNTSINHIFSKLYEDEQKVENSIFDLNRFFNKKDNATFHTTLKESLVFDFRNKDIIINESANQLEEEKREKINYLLMNHKYHDYIEIDKDLFSSNSKLSIDDIILLLEKTNNFNFPVLIKSALKFRKLKHYKALGIYFSFSKQLGLDYREGIGSYIHELAHHIDLNTRNYNRNRIVYYLEEYFKNKIHERVNYYMKSEELIARAAEISLVLLLGRYEQYKKFYEKGEINSTTFIKAINESFLKSKYSNFMATLESYKSPEYFDYEGAIMNNDFKGIEYLITYFKSFWSGKPLSHKEENKLPSNTNINYSNENKFVKKSEYSYNNFYRGLFEDKIKLGS
ncbi:hypothetical protein, partial [Aliarcobacter butzleri]|uniref:hypothetical protein n=1 Tax=Aliarcobacter butzleri TaxID=28197 RepID=UPI0034500D72